MIDYYETKSQPITRVNVWEAYWKVRKNKGGMGIDGMSLPNRTQSPPTTRQVNG